MPDTKITALTALTTADPATDMFPIVDVSDTTMAASGTTKRISINNILACSPTATLASATITGAATVGTTLGVTGVSTFAAGTALLPALTTTGDTNTGIYYPAADTFAVTTGGTERYRVDSSGNVGIGVTPSVGKGCLQLSSGINFPATQVASSDANTLDDYEEGTWTGTLKGSVSDPTTPVTATGKYTKIGRQVFVEITFNGVNTTGASGNITVTGLTFPCGSNINGVGVVSLNQIGTFTGSPYVFLSQSTSVLELYGNVSAGAGAAITHNAGALRYMTISLTYTV
jgi:hypothetical protein